MYRPVGPGLRAIRIADSVVNTAVLIVILLLLAIGGYALWDSGQVSDAASSERYEVYRPTEVDEGRSFAELKALNDDVFAWLTVYGTHIDYPVTQGEDNMKYVNTDAEGRYSLSGSIFLDEGSSRDFSDFNSILYGHHMERQTMFGEIGSFVDKAYFDARRYGALYYGGRWHGLEFFAFLRADAYDGSVFRVKVTGRQEQQGYLDMLLGMADHTRDVGVGTNDRIVLLSTCSPSPTNGRDILVGRIMNEVQEDPFAVQGDNETKAGGDAPDAAGTDGLRMVIILAAAVIAAILALAYNHRKRREKDDRDEHE
jgi:sortase B